MPKKKADDRISVKLPKQYLYLKELIEKAAKDRERSENFLVIEALREHFK